MRGIVTVGVYCESAEVLGKGVVTSVDSKMEVGVNGGSAVLEIDEETTVS